MKKKRFPSKGKPYRVVPPGSNMLKYRNGMLWPEKLAVKMGYKQLLGYSSSSSDFLNRSYNINYLNDIGMTFSPPDYDHLATVYNRVWVKGISMKIRLLNHATGSTITACCYPGIYSTDLSTTNALRIQALNNVDSSTFLLGLSGSGKEFVTYKKYLSVAHFYPDVSESSLSCSTQSADTPGAPLYFNIWFLSNTTGVDIRVVAKYDITFYVVWQNPRIQNVDTSPVA
jgi:hypothetical protein